MDTRVVRTNIQILRQPRNTLHDVKFDACCFTDLYSQAYADLWCVPVLSLCLIVHMV